jgi:hypothetical protein
MSAERDGRPVSRGIRSSGSDSGRISVSGQRGSRHGHGFRTRQSVTVSDTDEADAENYHALRRKCPRALLPSDVLSNARGGASHR